MARYVAFLRGINLGSTNKVSMPELRAMATDLGYTDVATYINSGNLIFSSTEEGRRAGEGDSARPSNSASAPTPTLRCVRRRS